MSTLPLAAHHVLPPRLLDVRGEFPGVPADWAYLDAAATSQKPRAVIEAINRAYAQDYATVHRGVYARSAHMTEAYEAAREAAAAHRELEKGHTRGKIVLAVGES